ncbi:MAG: hypothetical protein AB1632_02695 [Nitrospirota bacterium]
MKREKGNMALKSFESQNVEFKPAYDYNAAGRSDWRVLREKILSASR